jgi:hypothetical protein
MLSQIVRLVKRLNLGHRSPSETPQEREAQIKRLMAIYANMDEPHKAAARAIVCAHYFHLVEASNKKELFQKLLAFGRKIASEWPQ